MIYFDYAAATGLDPQVLRVMSPYMTSDFYNPSALYTPARKVRGILDDQRSLVAGILGVKQSEICFTAGATESINLAIGGLLRKNPERNIAIAATEHSSVVAAAQGYGIGNVSTLPVKTSGLIDVDQIAQHVDDKTVLISVGYVNGEIGTIQPMRDIARVVSEINESRQLRGVDCPLYLHSDASQAAEYIDLKPQSIGIDLLTLNGGKIYGPKQSGLLYVRHGIDLEPLIYGGGQERGLRGGSENVPVVVGFALALKIAQENHKNEGHRQLQLRNHLERGLKNISKAQINGTLKQRVAGNLNVSFPGVQGETLVHYLDARGIMTATGAACNASNQTPSRTLTAIGLDPELIAGSLRLSLGRGTDEKHVEALIEALEELVPKLRSQAANSL